MAWSADRQSNRPYSFNFLCPPSVPLTVPTIEPLGVSNVYLPAIIAHLLN